MRWWIGVLGVVGAIGLTPVAAPAGLAAQAAEAERAAGVNAESEPLRAGDVVRLRVWADTLLHGEFPVDERGHVVLPRLGSRDVRALAPQALRDQVVAEYRRMLRDPAVEVLTFRRVLVLGAVRNPGAHHLPTGQSTLSDALGAAGGVTPDGRNDRVRITRGGNTEEHRFRGGLRPSDLALLSGDEVVVPERPWLARNQAVMATVISSAVSVLVAVILVTN